MPNKKNKQRNGFYYFMKEMLEDMQRKGKVEYNMQNIATIAHPHWKNLPQEEKDIYTNLAKKMKQETKECFDGKLDCTGLPIKETLAEERQKEQINNAKLRNIKCKVKELMDSKAIANEKFHVISCNIFCLTEENVYVPAEVGLVEYSIAKGITKQYHEFIDPGELPLGYTYASMHHSEETHQIPPHNFEHSNKNYMFIYRSIKSFITSSDDRKLVVYCFPDEMDQIEGVLDWLRQRSHVQENEFHIYDLSALLMELRQHGTHAHVQSMVIARDILTKNVFDYVSNISCAWHEEKDVPNHCALGIAKRYCYLMSDYLCKSYDIEMIPNKHLPLKDDSESISIVSPLPVKWNKDAAPPSSRSQSLAKSTKPDKKSATIVSNLPSKYTTKEEKLLIPGAEAGVVTEIPKNQHPRLPTCNEPPRPHFSSAATLLKGSGSFELIEEDFPSLGALSIGRGRGRGLFSAVAKPAEPPRPTNLTSAGIGRGCVWKIKE